MITKREIFDKKSQVPGEGSLDNNSRNDAKSKGFSMIEVVVGIALVGVALLGLAQLFCLSVMNNARSDAMTNSIFLAQQQIDFLRNLSAPELYNLSLSPIDELMDINSDGTVDFRRITQLAASGFSWNVRVMVFSGLQAQVAMDNLIASPSEYRVRADVSTIISR
ncbi:MAG: prepilin-type N-terminal cleavage/methylation domain-containing protein [Candidatus Aminicenantes bacterium]|jgi:prepilin-type N-terminal cleavage/methylation domain-containing protein|nr:prepilin-type N-terminal cleavage/methylation domain-containing protein [Candidatus Aminicenantes bacterium]